MKVKMSLSWAILRLLYYAVARTRWPGQAPPGDQFQNPCSRWKEWSILRKIDTASIS